MSLSLPTPANARLWRSRILRAKDKRKNWAKESQENIQLGNNEPGAWAARTPVAGDRTGKTAVVVRNTIGMNARQEVNRMMPKEPKWVAKPIVPFVYEESENGEVIEQPNTDRCAILGTACNFVSNATDMPGELERSALDGEYTNRGFAKTGFIGGPDVSHTAPTPIDSVDAGSSDTQDLSAKEKKVARRPGISHGSVKPYLPYVVRIAPDKVLSDPDAATDREVNWYAQEVTRPLEAMKGEKINSVDWEARKVKTTPKYENLDKLKPNAKPGDKNTPGDTKSTEGYGEDFLTFWEIHYRVPEEEANTTRDGFEYYILSIVDYQEGASGEQPPVAIRHERYPIDVAGFYFTAYTANLVNDDLDGFVPGIRDSKGPSELFNMLASNMVNWTCRNKTVRWYNKNAIAEDEVQLLADAEALDFVGLDIKNNAPVESLMGVVPASPMPNDMVTMPQFFLNLTNEQTGRSNNQRGDVAGARTASEANIVAQETSGQVAAKQKRFRKFGAEVMRKAMIIFTHVLPDEGPMKEGRWALPDPEAPGKFLQFQKRDLFAQADIELDLTSQVLRDDTVVVQQGMQLLDVLSKILTAPPQIFERLIPLLERVIAAMGPDWEAKARKMFSPQTDARDPRNEHLMIAAGSPIKVEQTDNHEQHIESHRALLKVASRHPGLSKLFMRPLGQDGEGQTWTPIAILADHLADHEEIAMKSGQGVAAGVLPRNKGRGVGSGSAPQAVPNQGEMAAGAASAGHSNTPGVRGMQGAG